MAKMVTYLAGMQHVPGAKMYASHLPKGQPLELRREPHNAYDKRAVEVYHGLQKLGYVPAVDSPMVAAVMDSGKTAVATLTRVTASSEITVCWDSGEAPNV
jgi:hypothetical protein